MFRTRILTVLLLGVISASLTDAAEHRVEVLKDGPPPDEVPAELRQVMNQTGFRVVRGSSRTVCEIWPCKKWITLDGFQATDERLYPFKPTQLVGLVRFRRRGNDFRDQQISRGLYTLRYALQPVDGNHEGTSPTRDFLLLVKVDSDGASKQWTVEELNTASAEAADSNHPAMFCLQPAEGERTAATMRHMEEKDWWILQFVSQAVSGGSEHPLAVDLIVAGHAEE